MEDEEEQQSANRLIRSSCSMSQNLHRSSKHAQCPFHTTLTSFQSSKSLIGLQNRSLTMVCTTIALGQFVSSRCLPLSSSSSFWIAGFSIDCVAEFSPFRNGPFLEQNNFLRFIEKNELSCHHRQSTRIKSQVSFTCKVPMMRNHLSPFRCVFDSEHTLILPMSP